MNVTFAVAVVSGAMLAHGVARSRPADALPPREACSLLTPEQVSAVFGVKVRPGVPFGPENCKWLEDVRRGDSPKKIVMTLIDQRAFAAAKMPFGNGVKKTEVSGIGDDAVYVTGVAGGPETLTVKKGDAAFTLYVQGLPDNQIRGAEKALALDIVAKL